MTGLYLFSVHFIPPLQSGVPLSCYDMREHDWPSVPQAGVDHVQLCPGLRSCPQGVTYETLHGLDVVRMEFFEVEQEHYPFLAEHGFDRDKEAVLARRIPGLN